MKACEKLFILIIVIITSSFICDKVFSDVRKNPFVDCFPRPKIEQRNIEPVENLTIHYEEEIFVPSIYNIAGLIWGAYKPKAIIGREIYGVGDKLGKGEIIKIDKEGVTVLFKEKEYVVTPRQRITLNLINNTENLINNTESEIN